MMASSMEHKREKGEAGIFRLRWRDTKKRTIENGCASNLNKNPKVRAYSWWSGVLWMMFAAELYDWWNIPLSDTDGRTSIVQ